MERFLRSVCRGEGAARACGEATVLLKHAQLTEIYSAEAGGVKKCGAKIDSRS